jgi:chromosome partitioning protein
MQTIVVNSQKGGSGKSTLCRVLSVEASRAGLSVYLIDFDRDGHTLTNWHQTREAEEPRRVELSITGLGEGLKLLEQQGADLVLIDTPPNSIQDMAEIFPLADLVLVPIKPTPDDLQAAAVTVAKLKALRLPFLFVITQAIQNTNITAQAIAALSHHGPVAETLLVNRVVYPAAFTDGRTPQEIDHKGQAAREVGKLWLNIKTCLHANMTDERKAANG